MQTVSTAEACASLPELLKQVNDGPVLIREGEKDVAVLVSPESYDTTEREKRFLRLKKLRDEASEELRANLAREGTSVDEFLAELLK